jgi:hypothetical protein
MAVSVQAAEIKESKDYRGKIVDILNLLIGLRLASPRSRRGKLSGMGNDRKPSR